MRNVDCKRKKKIPKKDFLAQTGKLRSYEMKFECLKPADPIRSVDDPLDVTLSYVKMARYKQQQQISSNCSTGQVEILAPAGSWEALAAALQAGADSVYFGVGKLNMRARAAMNFTTQDLPEIVNRCHNIGVRAYLTMNNVLYDEEAAEARSMVCAAADAKIDAIICHDFSVVQVVREAGLPVHLSTQANIANLAAVRFYAQFADVVVLARELTLPQIQHITRAVAAEDIRGPSGRLVRIEAFVHGALCVAISGKCQMSLAHYDHSANRGDCLQSCRRAYTVTDSQTGQAFAIENEYVMSPKDLCTIGCLDDIITAGVEILKIEGRGRSADYVAATVSCYREARDAISAGNFTEAAVAQWRARLDAVFNRGFWEGGYYLGRKGEEWSGYSGNRARETKQQIGRVHNYFAKPGIVELELTEADLPAGSTLLVMGPTTGVVRFRADSLLVEGQPVNTAPKGTHATCFIGDKVRRNDRLFLLKEKTGLLV